MSSNFHHQDRPQTPSIHPSIHPSIKHHHSTTPTTSNHTSAHTSPATSCKPYNTYIPINKPPPPLPLSLLPSTKSINSTHSACTTTHNLGQRITIPPSHSSFFAVPHKGRPWGMHAQANPQTPPGVTIFPPLPRLTWSIQSSNLA